MGGPGRGEEHVLLGPGERDTQKAKSAAIKRAKPQGDSKKKETRRSITSSFGPFDKRGRNHYDAADNNNITIDKLYDATTIYTIFATYTFHSFLFRFSVSEASY